jgi:hypothetical protein
MEATTIVTATIGDKEIERPSSPTPSEGSGIYFNLDEDDSKDAEQNASSTPPASPTLTNETKNTFVETSSTTTSTAPILQGKEQNSLLTPPPTPATLSHETFLVNKVEISQTSFIRDTEQDSVIKQLITPPSTPPARPNFSFQKTFKTLEISPTSSSERSTDSDSKSSDQDLQSPITQRSVSPSLEPLDSDLKPNPPKPTPKKQLSCLQCHLAGLPCSLTASLHHRLTPLPQTTTLCCSRCARNDESFCIKQVTIEQEQAQSHQSWGKKLGERKKKEGECTYFAEGVESEVVLKRAEEMWEARRAKTRFMLPQLSVWKQEMLKPGFGWLVNGSREEWKQRGLGGVNWLEGLG